MAQGKPGKSLSNTGQVPEKQAEKTGQNTSSAALSTVDLFPREAFRDVMDLRIPLVDAEPHIQHELFVDLDNDAKKCGVYSTFVAHGTDERGHWVGWAPLH
jgi:hypothetical protein